MIAEISFDAIWSFCFDTKYMHNELWRWLALFGLLLAGLIIGKIISFVFNRHANRLEQADRAPLLAMLLRSLAGPITLLLLAAALYVSGAFLFIEKIITVGEGEAAKQVVKLRRLATDPTWINACRTLFVLAIGWFTFRLVDVIEFFLLRWTAKTDTLLDDQLVPLIRKTLRLFVIIMLGLFIAQNILGLKIGTLVAGLGIGGLAFALAAKDTLSNLFGSMTIFSDRPFHLGDRIKISGHDGIVEEVGFRSTRIRTLMGHQVVIPNATVANEFVENIGRRPYLKRTFEVGLTYDTTPDKLRRGVEIIHEMFDAHKEHFDPDTNARVHFTDFAACSLNISICYWFAKVDWEAYLQFNHEFNMELLQRFNDEGLEFAFPTQTLYVKKD